MVAYRLEGPKWTTTPITWSFAGYNYINKYRYDQSPYLSLPIRPDGEILMADRWYSPPSTGATVSVVRGTYSRSRFSVGTTGIHAYNTTEGLIPAGKKIYLEFPSTCNNNDTTNLVWGMTSATRSGFRGSAISGAGNVYWTAVPNHLTINGV